MLRPAATLDRARLGELGVARISTGSLLYRATVRDGRPPGDAVPYDEVQERSQTSSSS